MKYDYVITWMWIWWLTLAALLANSWKSVAIFEKHYLAWWYGHTFKRKGFHFNPWWHYVWNCGEWEQVNKVLNKMNLDEKIKFSRLDPKGFDRVYTKWVDYKIGSWFDRESERLSKLFPDHIISIKKYFKIISEIFKQTTSLPKNFSTKDIISHPIKNSHIIKYHNYTLQDLYDKLDIPLELQCILAWQWSIFFLHPAKLSLIIHALWVSLYDRGAYHPKISYELVVDSLHDVIKNKDNCISHLSTEVLKFNLDSDGKKVISLETKKWEIIEWENFIYNWDPKLSIDLIWSEFFPETFKKKLDYKYSLWALTIFIWVKWYDMKKYIGEENIFYYSEPDINAIYEDHISDWVPDKLHFFLNSPSIRAPGLLAPEWCDQIVAIAPCSYSYFKKLKDENIDEYNRKKEEYAQKIIDVISEKFLPWFEDFIIEKNVWTPTTSLKFVNTPDGNCYWWELNLDHIHSSLNSKSPFSNFKYIWAGSSFPWFAPLIGKAADMYTEYTWDSI